MHYVAAAVMITIYMYNLPLMIAVMWRDGRYVMGHGVLDGRYAINSAHRNLERKRSLKNKKKKPAAAIRTAAYLARRIYIESFTARLLVGTGDAALTAVLCGLLNTLGGVLTCAAGQSDVDIRPDFFGEGFRGEINMVVSVKLGRLVGAAARSAVKGG